MKFGAVALAAGLLIGVSPASAAPERLGSVAVHPCADGGRWLCGKLPDDDVVHVRLAWDQRSRVARARVGSSVLSLPAP